LGQLFVAGYIHSYRRRVVKLLAAEGITTIRVESVPWVFSAHLSEFFQLDSRLCLEVATAVQQLAWAWGAVDSERSLLLSPETLKVGSLSVEVVLILIRVKGQCGVVVTLAEEFPLGPSYWADRVLLDTELNHLASTMDEGGCA
jgi:hypothetical protein